MNKRKKHNRKRKRREFRRRSEAFGMQEGIVVTPMSNRSPLRTDWAGTDSTIGDCVTKEAQRTLRAYHSQSILVLEHSNQEEDTARGGYAHRQLFELVQNSADSLGSLGRGRIRIRLTSTHLYCADEGKPIDEAGVRALMFSHLSPKRGTEEIGRFGLGFKAVLGVSDTPEFFSRSGSFRFDRTKAVERIRAIVPEAQRFPVLRLPEAIDPWPEMEADSVLRELMGWATNIVRLPLKPKTHEFLRGQITDFPSEFLLFVDHVSELVLQIDKHGTPRAITIRITSGSNHRILQDTGSNARWFVWFVFKDVHKLSHEARSDSRSLDDADEAPISWAVPIDRLNESGYFWAFFPTTTTSLLSGILNAPWKTNEDRQNLLPGHYNNELIAAAAVLGANSLHQLSTSEDPARHLDALPRREEAGDNEHSRQLRIKLYLNLTSRDIIPDQNGRLRKLRELAYPPGELTSGQQTASDALERWAEYEGRPSAWLHHSALSRNRLARLEQLWQSANANWFSRELPRVTVAEWLEALVEDGNGDTPAGSMAALQTAALLPKSIREVNSLGSIVLTATGGWVAPNPDAVFLSDGQASISGGTHIVHPRLEADPETLAALKELGIKPATYESMFREIAANLLRTHVDQGQPIGSNAWQEFWRLTRKIDTQKAVKIIYESARQANWRDMLCVRSVAGNWQTLFQTLLPGPIVPADSSRDANVAIDTRFHEEDLPLLEQLGAVDVPRGGHELSSHQYRRFIRHCRSEFCKQDFLHSSTPRVNYLNFIKSVTTGPLDVLQSLSEEGMALYTRHMLDLSATYELWTIRHDTRDIYPPMPFESPAIRTLRQHGRVKTADGIYPLSYGLGNPPNDPAVLRVLCSHPQADSIREAFGIVVNTGFYPGGEDTPIPLLDAWPGLKDHVPLVQPDLQLIRCDTILEIGGGGDTDCIHQDEVVYVTRKDDREELQAILEALGLRLSSEQIERILIGWTDADVQAAREEVRNCETDDERLLKAVGAVKLKRKLPLGLVTIFEDDLGPLSEIQIARAAIATFHSSALREYHYALNHLDPPRQWAGGARAIEFVRSLGFDEEWAGTQNTQRDPFVEVDGPNSLPDLHGYQRRVVSNVRSLIQSNGALGERRGMLSLPTGSGKTRVAVQAIVEAIREGDLKGGILWVADRDELCEQAVEAWRQVWSSEGTQEERLRISRMWEGQPPPLPTGDMHVIVATIQTLAARIKREPHRFKFLADFKLVLFDEAHRSVAPTFTSVMQELGLTRWQKVDEPLLIGLTATPYRGHDERETERLVNRYSSNRLDAGAFASDDPEDVIRELQGMRVLAQADHEIIDGGEFSLSPDEQQQSLETPWLPRSVENRIAGDATRTKRIVQAYLDHVCWDWPTLIFATSVEHSQIVAALLSSKGIAARAVSAKTDRSTRRRIVEEFRAGRIKALVNYGIFREGFDAPKTRSIIVARPVYSPNLYFQMIGRGLRGVKNGGNDRCLILNVRDNIDNFERRLAFADLDWLWA